MSTMVVQERHLWLNLAEMKDIDKARFLDAPISQAGLFGDTVEGFAQQFSAVQQQTQAIQHILPLHDAPTTAAPGTRPQSVRRRGCPPELLRPRLNRHLDRLVLPPGSQVHEMTVCDTQLPHSCQRPILPAAKRVRFGDAVPPHAPACTASGGVAHTAQPVSLAQAHMSTRLLDSVRQAQAPV